MKRFLKTLLIVFCLLLTSRTYSQSNSDSLIFIRFGSVYRSNLIDFPTTNMLMLKFKTIPNNFTYDGIFCNLSKGVFKDYSSNSINDDDIVDSLSKIFFIYKVEFESNEDGRVADSTLTKSNSYIGYLIPLQVERGVVTHRILQRWIGKFDFVRYRITNRDCNEDNQRCVVKIESLK